jgi:hypothetical protein
MALNAAKQHWNSDQDSGDCRNGIMERYKVLMGYGGKELNMDQGWSCK